MNHAECPAASGFFNSLLDTYAKESARVADVQLRAVSEKLKGDIAKVAREIGSMATLAMPTSDSFGMPQDLVRYTYEATSQYKAFREALVQLRQGMDDGSISIARFRDEVAKVGVASADPAVRKLADELITLTNEAFRAEQALGGSARAVNVLSSAASAGAPSLLAYSTALRSLQMGVPEMAKVITAQKEMGEASKAYAEGAQGARDAMTAGGMTERASAAALDTYAKRMKELNTTFEARKGVITGATELEKDFGETLRTTTIAGLEGVARGNAQAQASYQERNRKIEDSIKLGLSEGEANKRRAESEKILAQELKNVAAAEAKKGASKSSNGSDAFDNALQRARDQIEELKLQQEAASKATFEVYRLTEAHRLRRAAMQAGRADEKGVAEQIDAAAEALARQRTATEASIQANRRLKESFDFAADGWKSFAEDLLTGTDGINGALKSLGRGFLSASLDALIKGGGTLADVADAENTELGALLGIAPAKPSGANDNVSDQHLHDAAGGARRHGRRGLSQRRDHDRRGAEGAPDRAPSHGAGGAGAKRPLPVAC